jgi:CO dehydrogenase nickel-insertion accessory protein CooC1
MTRSSHGLTRIIVHNHKGGTGKTMIAVHLADYFAERGGAWCLLDADSQCNSISWITGHAWQGEEAVRLPGEGRRAPLVATVDPSAAKQHDRVLIDTPPSDDALERLAGWGLAPGPGDVVVCPAGGRFAIDGAIKVAEEVGPSGARVVVVANQTDPKEGHGAEEIQALRELESVAESGIEVFKMAIPDNKKYMRQAELEGAPVWELPHAPRTHAVRALEAFCRWMAQGAPEEANRLGALGAGLDTDEKRRRVRQMQERLWG